MAGRYHRVFRGFGGLTTIAVNIKLLMKLLVVDWGNRR